MTENDNDQRPENVTGERTCAFRADFTNEQDAVLLDQATTTAGRHPNSDIFLDDITVSRRTPSSGA
jgi:pSer/pThr/pTyr-binding forkhead associated (FHA) protein